MANPAPTINQINAFNATQGTTIDFNIIGGTELVRSNRIYIYDLSDNSLICTHLYVSTESIHELPANTDGSILYADGKSSADFVNGAQYYAQIQTFTDIAGTEGGSGLSVAKMFWCLVDPTLTITTIPSTISTTSYNVSATYDANTSVVSNIIQQYQFNLYNATGSLLQSSGVVVGNGEQQGTSTAYDISYNFTGLSVGSSYYVTVEVTTTQGMSVSAQSNTFTVSIDTPTLGEATVVNNACDGYISVTSNLSGEYGGSGSGEIVSFETDSENVFTKLQVDLEPLQDLHGYDAPWVGGAGKNLIDSSNLFQNGANRVDIGTQAFDYHTYLKAGTYTFSNNGVGVVYCQLQGSSSTIDIHNQTVQSGTFTITQDGYYAFWVYYWNGISVSDVTDVQLEKGSTATSYAPYENICPISGHDEVGVSVYGKNLLNSNSMTDGYISYDGTINASSGAPRYEKVSDYIPIESGRPYVFSCTIDNADEKWVGIGIYNANKAFIGRIGSTLGNSKNVVQALTSSQTSGAYYARISLRTYNNMTDAQFEEGTEPTEYEEYKYYTTTLPSTTYGGTLDVVSGLLTVDRVKYTITGSNISSSGKEGSMFRINLSGINYGANNTYKSGISNRYIVATSYGDVANTNGSVGFNSANSSQMLLRDDSLANTPAIQASLNATPLEIVYPLATPQTYQLTPQQIQTLVGKNNVWSEQGEISLAYHIPITNLLVKRQDVDDVSGSWLTLYSQPITQASDMDFTFIDFTNQYGKTYKYALVPLLTQTQSGVEVEVEGGYTVSDEVQSVFDGVFIVDSTGSQKCKANVGYGNVDMNQTVGTITPIGAKHPVVITNSKNQYHNGSISGTIVPDDYYFNGNLSRIDMVNKRDELEQFLTNKRAKIIKDWNGKIWLVMIMDNVSCTFNNNYGMGIVNFSTNWVEVGDPTNQQDLQATGLINVGGV